MNTNGRGAHLRIFISSTDKTNGETLSESLVVLAKKHHLAGATVTKGIIGYGASSVIHAYKFWEVAEKVPVIVELIDDEEKIRNFFEIIRPILEEMRHGCLVTLSTVDVLLYKAGTKKTFGQ